MKRYPMVLCLVILLMACQQKVVPPTAPSVAQQSTATAEPTMAAPPSPTSTNTPIPTLTATPQPSATATPLPSATPTPSPTISVVEAGTPVYEPSAAVNPANAPQLAELARWGRGGINDVAYSGDGNWIVVGTSRGIYVHSAQNFQGNPQQIELAGGVTAVAISPDGQLVAAALNRREVQVWRLADQTMLFSQPVAYSDKLQFSPNGDMLLAVTSEGVQLWDSQTGLLIDSYPPSLDAAFSPSGELLAIWGYDGASLYRLADHTLLFQNEWQLQSITAEEVARYEDGFSEIFRSLRFVGEEEFITLVHADDNLHGMFGVVEIQQEPIGQLLFRAEAINQLSSPVQAVCDETIFFADPPGLIVPWTMEYSASEQIVALFYEDYGYSNDLREYSSVRFYGMNDGQRLYQVEEGIVDIAFAPDGQTWVAATQDGHLQLRQVRDGALVDNFTGYSGPALAIIPSPNSQLAAVESLTDTTLYRVADGSLLAQYPATQIAFSPTQPLFALGYPDGRLELRDTADGSLRTTLTSHTEGITSLAFVDNGQTLVSAGLDCQLNLWQVADGQRLGELEAVIVPDRFSEEPKAARIWDLYPIANQDLLVGLLDSEVAIWNTANQKLLGNYTIGSHSETIAVSLDGRYLAAAGYPTRLWEIAPEGQLTELWAEEENAYSVAIAPDNQLLVAGLGGNYYLGRTTPNMALNGALRLFNMQTQQLLHLLSPQTMQSTAVVFTPNGRFLLSSSLDGVIRLWGVP